MGDVMGRRAMARRAEQQQAELDEAAEQEFRDLVEDTVAEVLPQLIVGCLSDPTVIRALRQALGGKTTTSGPTPLRAAEIKRRR